MAVFCEKFDVFLRKTAFLWEEGKIRSLVRCTCEDAGVVLMRETVRGRKATRDFGRLTALSEGPRTRVQRPIRCLVIQPNCRPVFCRKPNRFPRFHRRTGAAHDGSADSRALIEFSRVPLCESIFPAFWAFFGRFGVKKD